MVCLADDHDRPSTNPNSAGRSRDGQANRPASGDDPYQPLCHFKNSPELIRLVAMLPVRYPPSPRNLEDLHDKRSAAQGNLGMPDHRVTGRWLNHRAENSHQSFRRREQAMVRFRRTRFHCRSVEVHSSIQILLNAERTPHCRNNHKANPAAALAERRQICVVCRPRSQGQRRSVRITLTAHASPLGLVVIRADSQRSVGAGPPMHRRRWQSG